eukprot:CAMPEP_0179423832 /NCGR_PEP_ID=MMETSP0799-20121207/11238_1 /TAXON_ID=46947 /ORGANISM="Geminigera cryophila, Strain CCMP2564" /LENGTH=345 /DNA_ID=CAMNT_0021198189 /DNA_START=1619 /DNA_END=2653 /DNA_ORIENTATION=+
MSEGEAAAHYESVANQLEQKIAALHSSPEATQAPEGANPRQNLYDLGDLLAHDSTKFHFLFENGLVSSKDALGMLAHSEPSFVKFYAWCTTVGSESKALEREVASLGGDVLLAFKAMLEVITGPLPAEACGRVMKAAEQLKRLPKNEVTAVQRSLLRDAAAVKSVVTDVGEMVLAQDDEQDELAEASSKMQGMDVGTDASTAGATDFGDIMNMDVSLGTEELAVVKTCLVIIEACLAMQKAACRVLMAPVEEGEHTHPPARATLENLAQASIAFTRAAEDLGALSILDPRAARGGGAAARRYCHRRAERQPRGSRRARGSDTRAAPHRPDSSRRTSLVFATRTYL